MKKESHYTIKDIANELGVSPSTVSRALSDHPQTSEEMKNKVREVVEKVGYRYNALAAGLRNSKSNTVGLIVPKISMFFQSTVVTAIQNKLREFGYNLMICQSNDSPALEKELVNVLYSSRVEGLIVAQTLFTEDFSHFDIFAERGIPLVFYDRVSKNYPAHKIQGDNYQGGYLSTKHLLEQGCRRIVHIGGPLGACSLYNDRYDGYRDALKKFNVELDEELVFFQELNRENALKVCEKLFAGQLYPDGVFACNDTTAITVMEEARKAGLTIPEQLKVVGYTNDPRAMIIDPALTSVEQFPYEVGEQAAILIMDLIQKKVKPNRSYITITTPVDLIKRASSEKSLVKSSYI